MRGKVARVLRKIAYGPDFSPRDRKYFRHPQQRWMCIADERRRKYQNLKKAYRQHLFVM